MQYARSDRVCCCRWGAERSTTTFQNQISRSLIFLWVLSAVRDRRRTDKEMKKKTFAQLVTFGIPLRGLKI